MTFYTTIYKIKSFDLSLSIYTNILYTQPDKKLSKLIIISRGKKNTFRHNK